MIEKNQEWEKEQKRVNQVIAEVEKKANQLLGKTEEMKKDIVELRKTFWEDVTVNVDEPDDIIETHASIKQRAELVAERERSHRQLNQQIQILKKLHSSPYFARIDFKEEGEPEAERVYIGIASLLDKEGENFLIYDWRAPISSLYYDYSPGPCQYETPSGTINGEMERKRQFIIRKGRIVNMFDTGITIGDELLQEVLGRQADTQMKTIVATIQQEQNQLIRNERSKYLVVQGAAGSGKTSAALQRIAYLLYRHRNELNRENILLFSPNPLFNSYIANVLPELGEENMQQTTFQEFAQKLLKTALTIEDPFSQMESLLISPENEEYHIRLAGIRFKSSLQFKALLDRYIHFLAKTGIPFHPIIFRGKELISSQEMENYFYSLDENMSIPNRLQQMAVWLLEQLAEKERAERKQDWVQKEMDLLSTEEYTAIFHKLQKNKRFSEETFDDFEREQQALAKLIVKRRFKPLKKFIHQWQFLNTTAIYNQFLDGGEWTGEEEFFPEKWNDICRFTKERLQHKELPYEDVTPFLYLCYRLKGQGLNKGIRHLFIDEAQDYSPFQFVYFKEIFPNARMTILGDIHQAIYVHAVHSLTSLNQEIEEMGTFENIVFTKSYRSTREIVEFTTHLINQQEVIEPFNRHGNKPVLTVAMDQADFRIKMIQCIRQLQDDGYGTIAIICKTAKESQQAFENLKTEMPVRLITTETYTYEKGMLILPAYLAKGIEFDAVVIYNASREQYHRKLEQKLFYTACTRAMHELRLFTLGERTPFLDRVPASLFIQN